MLEIRHCSLVFTFVLLVQATGNAFAHDQCANLYDLDWWGSASESNVREELARCVNSADKDSWTPLHHALEAQASPEAVFLLVESGADINAVTDLRRTTPLALAAFKHSLSVSQYLLDHGADPAAVGSKGETLLHYAAANPDPQVAALLIGLGLKATSLDQSRRTPLHAVAHSNSNPEVARLLLENGAPLKAQDRLGRTAWDTAVLNRNPDMLAFLTEQEAKANTEKAFGGYHDLRAAHSLSMTAKANTEKVFGGYRALHFAVMPLRSTGVAEFLIKHGANVDVTDGEWDGTPLHWSQANPATSRLLLENGADIESRDKRGRTPLFWAAVNANRDKSGTLYAKYLEVMKILLDGGANVNAEDAQGRTPLLAALMIEADPEAIGILLEHGADPNKSDNWACSPLAIAKRFYAEPGETEALLIRHGAQWGFASYLGQIRCILNMLARSSVRET